MEVIKLAQEEMNSIVAERRVLAAPIGNIPPAADRHLKLREEVLDFWTEEKKWIGPYNFMDFIGRQVTIRSKHGTRRNMFTTLKI